MRFKNIFKLSGFLFCFQIILFALVIIGSTPNLIASARLHNALYFPSQPSQPLLRLEANPANYQLTIGQVEPTFISLDTGGRHLKSITLELTSNHAQGIINNFTFSPTFCSQPKTVKNLDADMLICTNVLNSSEQFTTIASFTYTPYGMGIDTISFGKNTQAAVSGIPLPVHPISAPSLTFTVK